MPTSAKAENGPQNADGRRITASSFPNPGGEFHFLFERIDLDFEHFAQTFGFGTVDEQLQAFAREVVGQLLDDGVERQQSFAARDVTPAGDLVDQALLVDHRRQPDPFGHAQTAHEGARRALQHHGAQCAANDDDQGRRLRQRTEMSTFEQLSADDRQQADQQPGKTDSIHCVCEASPARHLVRECARADASPPDCATGRRGIR